MESKRGKEYSKFPCSTLLCLKRILPRLWVKQPRSKDTWARMRLVRSYGWPVGPESWIASPRETLMFLMCNKSGMRKAALPTRSTRSYLCNCLHSGSEKAQEFWIRSQSARACHLALCVSKALSAIWKWCGLIVVIANWTDHFHFVCGKTEAHRYLSDLPQVSELESRRASFWDQEIWLREFPL